MKKVSGWGGKQQKAFDVLKEMINRPLVLALRDSRQSFQIQGDASDYVMGAVLLKHGKPICFDLETFN